MVTVPDVPSISPNSRCKVSEDAKFISSSSTQSPFLIALTRIPSVNVNARPLVEATLCLSNFFALVANFSHCPRDGFGDCWVLRAAFVGLSLASPILEAFMKHWASFL